MEVAAELVRPCRPCPEDSPPVIRVMASHESPQIKGDIVKKHKRKFEMLNIFKIKIFLIMLFINLSY
jgi:hypothetical protein